MSLAIDRSWSAPNPAAVTQSDRVMRIVYLHQYFTTPDSHGGTRSYEVARRLVARGHEVHMVTAWPENDGRRGWFRTKESGIQVHWVPVPYSNQLSYSARIAAFFHFAYQAGRKAASIPADLVFATSTPLTIALPAVYAARRQKVPMVFEVRDLWPTLPIAVGALRSPLTIAGARWLERFAYRNAEHVIALSPGMREGVLATGYDPRRISVIPNSCDNGLFSAVTREEARRWLLERHPELVGGPIVGYTGTIGHINAVEYLVEMAAASLARSSGLKFVIFGEGAQQQAVETLAQERGVLGRNLWLHRPLSKKEMPLVIKALDVATSLFKDIPEMWHNSANKFFDALAAGRPVLINYGGWQAALLQRSGAGLVAPAGEPAAAVDLVKAFLSDAERVAAASAAAERLAQEEFDRDLLAGRLADVLTEVRSSWRDRRRVTA